MFLAGNLMTAFIWCKMSARMPKVVFLRFPNFNLFLDYPYHAGYPVAGTKPLVRIWLLNIAMFISI